MGAAVWDTATTPTLDGSGRTYYHSALDESGRTHYHSALGGSGRTHPLTTRLLSPCDHVYHLSNSKDKYQLYLSSCDTDYNMMCIERIKHIDKALNACACNSATVVWSEKTNVCNI